MRVALGPTLRRLRPDAIAGIPGAIGSVPDGMAAAVLAGVNPIHGLYASFVGPIVGGGIASTELMVVTTTSAAALAAGSALADLDPAQRANALFLLTFIAGLAMVAASMARLGRYTRFVAHSVMLGFLTGVAVNIAFGQLASLTGAESTGSVALTRGLSILLHPSRIHVASLFVGAGTVALLIAVGRSPVRSFATLVALGIPTVVVAIAGLDGVATVSDGGGIPRGLPIPSLPHLRELSVSTISGALAVAAIVLVQGAGVAESVPNPGHRRSDANRDFMAQGAANLASGLLSGQPVGGSVGQTALNRVAGARTRWAAIFSGIWMGLILVLLAPVVGYVPMPCLAALLIFAAAGSLRFRSLVTVFRTSSTSAIALTATFLFTLVIPVALAVGLGVTLSLLLQLNRDALDLRVVELKVRPDGQLEECPAPASLRSDDVVVLDVLGSLLYAGARTFEARLPSVVGTQRPVLIVRLRGRTEVSSTFFSVLAGYARLLDEVDGRLYLSGLSPQLTGALRVAGPAAGTLPIRLVEATPVLGESTRRAYDDATSWLIGPDDETPSV
jgi:SulP family sulfate permease